MGEAGTNRLKSNLNSHAFIPLAAMTSSDTKVFKTYMCLICGFIYDEEAGSPDEGIPPGTKWDDVPMNWTCPECGARKEDFEMVEI